MPGFTLCEDTGMLAVDGACPAHRGDACLREYVPATALTEVAAAARCLVSDHNVGDFVYAIRERANDRDPHYEGNSWEHPLVTSFARAVETLRAFGESSTFGAPAPAAPGGAPTVERPTPAPVDDGGTGFDLRAARATLARIGRGEMCPRCGSATGRCIPGCKDFERPPQVAPAQGPPPGMVQVDCTVCGRPSTMWALPDVLPSIKRAWCADCHRADERERRAEEQRDPLELSPLDGVYSEDAYQAAVQREKRRQQR